MHKTMMTSGRWVLLLVVAVRGLNTTTLGKMQASAVSERELREALVPDARSPIFPWQSTGAFGS